MIILSIKEMHCAGCVTTIERALTQVSGVRSVKVNLSDKSAAVGGDVSAELLIDAVSKTGYKAVLKYSE